MGQLLLYAFDLALLQHLHAAKRVLDSVGRVRLANQALPFFGTRRDETHLEFFATALECSDPLGHRILDGHRGVDRKDDCCGSYADKDRADDIDVEAEEGGAGHGVHCSSLSSTQISKLTILAMMKPPMLIHTRPPSPVTIRRSSSKKPPIYVGFTQ